MKNKGTKFMIMLFPRLNPILVYPPPAALFINHPPIYRLLSWLLCETPESRRNVGCFRKLGEHISIVRGVWSIVGETRAVKIIWERS